MAFISLLMTETIPTLQYFLTRKLTKFHAMNASVPCATLLSMTLTLGIIAMIILTHFLLWLIQDVTHQF